MDKLPAEYNPPRDHKFEQHLTSMLRSTEELPGGFTIGQHGQIDYTEKDPTSSIGILLRTPKEIPDLSRTEHVLAHRDEYFARAKRYLIASRKVTTISHMLHPSVNLEASCFTTITDQTIGILPSLNAIREVQDVLPHADLAHLTLRRALDFEPAEAQQAFTAIAQTCRHHNDQVGNIPYLDKYISAMTTWLQHAAAGARHSNTNHDRSLEWRYNIKGKHSEQNLHNAITAFDTAGLIPPQFWQAFLSIPLSTQSFTAANLLADKIKSDAAPSIMENIRAEDRPQIIGGVLAAAIQRAYQHPARDKNTLRIIQQSTQPHRHQPEVLSVDKAVRLADKIIRQHYNKELSSLRSDETFSDIGQALSFLLRLSIKPDAPAEQIALANEEAAIYIDVIQGIVEHTHRPVIRTIGDLALRYANASPDELEYLKRSFNIGGVNKSDALWRKHYRGKRRDRLYKPGYGEIS